MTEKNIDPMTSVKSKMQSDKDYAHTWFVNLHNLVRDSQGTVSYTHLTLPTTPYV